MANKSIQVKHISDDICKEADRLARSSFDRKSTTSPPKVTYYRPKVTYPWCTAHYVQELTGAPYKVALRKLEQMVKRGLMNYGVSLRTAWWCDEEGYAQVVER